MLDAAKGRSGIVCLCNNVSFEEIRKAFENGARTMDALAAAAHFGNGCSMCRQNVVAYLQELMEYENAEVR